MGVVVQKYGGSSVGDLERIGRVADRVAATRAEGHDVCVVVSAMGSTTNNLIALAKSAAKAPDRRELDMLISTGERQTMALLAMALIDRGIKARSLTGSQSGIITDEAHADARVVAVRPERVRQHLADGEVVIVAGFQGVSRAKEVTTLGRGGSDTTAVVLAAALQADWCEICSDVDGVWSADPRVVPDAAKLDTIGLDEALSLARAGAKVLFEDAVRYARDHGVEILAASTFGPGTGTRLVKETTARVGAVAVTGDAQLAVVRVTSNGPAVCEAIRRDGGRLRRRVGDRLWVDLRNAHAGLNLPEGGELVGPAAMVTAVGSGLGERADVGFRMGEALAAAGIGVLSAGSEGDMLWWEVRPEDVGAATRVVHGVG